MKVILIIAALALAGCMKDPVASASTDNAQIRVDELLTHNGVTVYRFVDNGRPVYFTSPPSDVASSHAEYCGKGCLRSVDTQTLGAR